MLSKLTVRKCLIISALLNCSLPKDFLSPFLLLVPCEYSAWHLGWGIKIAARHGGWLGRCTSAIMPKCSPTNTGLTRFGFTELFMSLCHFCLCLNGLVLSRLCLCATHFYGWSCTCICLSSGRRNWGKVIKKNIRGMGIYFWNRNYSLLLWQKTNSCITVYCLNWVDGYEPFLLVHILRIRGISYMRYFDLCCMVFHWFQGWC